MRLSFGNFLLDLNERRLWKQDEEILLPPKAFDVLSYLTRHPGQLVQRDQLMRELWPDTFVDDHALSFQIAEVRKALGDDPKTPSYIETRPRRGYRFLADVEQEGAAGRTEPAPAAARPEPAMAEVKPAAIAPDEIPDTHYAQSGDVNIAYQVMGHGPIDVVFVMGWVSHLEYFWREPNFARFLRRLASFSRLILFDKRGTGLSDRVPLHQLPTLELRMDDVRAVMDAVGSQRAVIVGVSEGGPLSVLFAATHPDKTLGLVMIGSYARRIRDEGYPWGPTAEESAAFCALIRREWGGPVGIEVRAPSMASDPAFRNWWATYLRMGASPGAAEALTRMNAEIDIRPILATVQVPTMVIHRTGDQCLRVEEGRFMAERIPGARLVELPGADHVPFSGPQEEILQPIEEFCANVRSAPERERALATVVFVEVPPNAATADPAFSSRLRREVEWFRGRGADFERGMPLASFDGPARAIRCAHSIVSQGAKHGHPLRAAVHTGECEFTAKGVPVGYTVELTGKIVPVANPGQVVVSRVVKDLVAGSGIQFARQEQLELPGELEDWPLFAVTVC
ncbi:MAG: alpha/beta fold hydrolase [Acidobacteria bacterium]|nr:alpha/beta fold hydrolase [Acidobacteriota bacterium]